MSGYYPEGTTGLEYEIAGPDQEKTITVDGLECTGHKGCPCYDNPTEHDGVEIEAAFFGWSVWGDWTCPACGHQNDWSGDADVYRG